MNKANTCVCKKKGFSVKPNMCSSQLGECSRSNIRSARRCINALGAFLFIAAFTFVPAAVDAWKGEVVLEQNPATAQTGDRVEIGIFAKITLEAGEQVVGIAQYELVWELDGLTFVSDTQGRVVTGRFLYRDSNIAASRDGNSALAENCPRTEASFFIDPSFMLPVPRPLATVKPGDTDPSCILGPFETLVLSVDGSVDSTPTLTIVDTVGGLISVILSVANSSLTNGPALKYSAGGDASGAFAPGAFGEPVAFRVVELDDEAQLVLSEPAIQGILNTSSNNSSDDAVHVLNVQLSDGGSDSFPSPMVTGFTMMSDVAVDAFTFELRSPANVVLATSVGAGQAVSFDGLAWRAEDGQATPMFAVHAYKSGPNGSLTDGQEITLSLESTASSVAIMATTTVVSGLSGQASQASFGIDVQAQQLLLAGSGTWDLTVPYALTFIGMDLDGNIDLGFTTDTALVDVQVGGDLQPWVAVTLVPVGDELGLPVTAYTADTDGVALSVRARIGDNVAAADLSTHSVTVDVVATMLVADGDAGTQPGIDGRSVVVTQAVNAVDANQIVDSDYSGIVVLDSSASTSGTVTALVSTNASGVEDIADGSGVAVIVVTVEAPGTSPPTVTLSLTAEDSDGARLMPFDLELQFQAAFNLDFDGDGSLAGVADFALLFFWETDRRSYQSERNGGASHEAALRAALQPSVDLGLLTDQNVLVAGEKLLAVLPPTPALAALLDFDGDMSLAGVADFALLFFWETDRRSYQSARNGGASHEAALRAALQPSVDLGLLNDQNVLVGGEKLLAVLNPAYAPPAAPSP